ncbi:hypothetical protein BSKO_09765 [Bryopsis sp. KO-2023]|nr:hypothetical protein BSKO_09765 [Bryopsis sp. KO-2023]
MCEGIEKSDQQRRQSAQAFFGGCRENVPVCGVDSRNSQLTALTHEPSIPVSSVGTATVSNRDLNPMWERDLRQKINAGIDRLPFQSIGNVQEHGGCGQTSIQGALPKSRISIMDSQTLEAEKALAGAFAGFSISGHSMVNGSTIHGLQHAQATPGLQSIPAVETRQSPQAHFNVPVYATGQPVSSINQQPSPALAGKAVDMGQSVHAMHSGQKGMVDDPTTKLVLDAMMNQQQLIQAGLQACLQNTLTVQSNQNSMVAAILQTVAQSQTTSVTSSPPNQLQALLQSLGAMAVQSAMNSAVGGRHHSSMASSRKDNQSPGRPQARDAPVDIPICYDFVQGKCSRRNCRYSHDTDRIIRHNSKEKGICFDYLRGECKRGAMCRFSHNLKDIVRRSHCEGSDLGQDTASVLSGLSSANSGKKWGKGICYDFVRGACSRGQNCPWSHDLMEIAVVTKRDSSLIGPSEQAKILFSTWGDMTESVDLVVDGSTQSSDCQHGVNETTDDTDPESEPHEWQTVADDDSQLFIENDIEVLTVEALEQFQQN